MTLKSVAIRAVLLAVGFGAGMLLFLLSSFIMGLVGMPPGYALYNGYFLAVVLWVFVAVPTYLYARKSDNNVRWNIAAMMAGVLVFPMMGAIAMLVQERQYLVFLPH